MEEKVRTITTRKNDEKVESEENWKKQISVRVLLARIHWSYVCEGEHFLLAKLLFVLGLLSFVEP